MTCGPADTAQQPSAQSAGTDAFSFGQDLFGAQMSAMALVWTAPWRAASVVMDEFIRETTDRLR